MTTRPTQTSVLESLEECRRLGDEAFLEKYAIGHQPLGHYLIHEDKRYPMKSCVGCGSQADNSHARFQDRRSPKGNSWRRSRRSSPSCQPTATGVSTLLKRQALAAGLMWSADRPQNRQAASPGRPSPTGRLP
jgi:hypothetical protein